jgi:3-hydroxyanthranilate 3,4-dioxygenase
MLVAPLRAFNLEEFRAAHREDWQDQGVLRRLVWEDSEYLTFLTRGPTTARQFHINPGDEIFYQLEGELQFHYLNAEGERALLVAKPGDWFLLPARVPHSPRRAEGSWTLVVERRRAAHEIDGWAWYCEGCGTHLYQTEDRSGGPGDFNSGQPRAFLVEAEQALRALGRCPKCGEAVPLPGQPLATATP